VIETVLPSSAEARIPYLDKCGDVVQELAEDGVNGAYEGVSRALHGLTSKAGDLSDLSGHLSEHTEKAYLEIRRLLLHLEKPVNPPHDWRPQHTGLKYTVSRKDGTIAWVSPGAVSLFDEEGSECLTIR
jgi:hypothetical protein